MPIERITIFCFAASYGAALALELLQLFWPREVQRLLRTLFACAGLLAHALFLIVQRPTLSSQLGSLVFLAWILAVFYLYGSLHHSGLSWGVFVLPVVLGLTVLAGLFTSQENAAGRSLPWERFWASVHGGLLLLAAVGVSVGFVASVMYLVQAWRLQAKMPPGQGLRLLSLERLETMNRRALNLAFPLLTAGLLSGLALMEGLHGWTDPKVIGVALLWLLFAVLLYLRYGAHLRGRRLALLTILAFALLVITLVAPSRHFWPGGP